MQDICPKCHIKVAKFDPEKVCLNNQLYHGKCVHAIAALNARVRPNPEPNLRPACPVWDPCQLWLFKELMQ